MTAIIISHGSRRFVARSSIRRPSASEVMIFSTSGRWVRNWVSRTFCQARPPIRPSSPMANRPRAAAQPSVTRHSMMSRRRAARREASSPLSRTSRAAVTVAGKGETQSPERKVTSRSLRARSAVGGAVRSMTVWLPPASRMSSSRRRARASSIWAGSGSGVPSGVAGSGRKRTEAGTRASVQ